MNKSWQKHTTENKKIDENLLKNNEIVQPSLYLSKQTVRESKQEDKISNLGI